VKSSAIYRGYIADTDIIRVFSPIKFFNEIYVSCHERYSIMYLLTEILYLVFFLYKIYIFVV